MDCRFGKGLCWGGDVSADFPSHGSDGMSVSYVVSPDDQTRPGRATRRFGKLPKRTGVQHERPNREVRDSASTHFRIVFSSFHSAL